MTVEAPIVRDIKRGHGSDERPLASVLWQRDSRPGSPALDWRGNFDPDHRNVDFRRYYDPAFMQAEFDTLWNKTWLYAAREEDVPNVGDRVPFDVGPMSYFIVRTGEDSFKAFRNSCLHRGTALCTKPQSGDTIRCPYHAWEWNIDGRLKRIPSHWDFPEITRLNASLPEVKLERWGGFIFINADPDAASLADALQIVPEHFKAFEPERRYTAGRFRKLVRANWKISQEAFMEAYHLFATHPEAVPFNGDSQTQYDVWVGENGTVGRNASCGGIPSMHAEPDVTNLYAAQMFAQGMKDWHYPDAELPVLDPDRDLRAQLGDWHRDQIAKTFGRTVDLPDAVMLDSFLYFVFPHSTFWLSESVPFTYAFMPHATDPGLSYFEVRMLLPNPAEGPPPPSAPVVELGPEDPVFGNVPPLGFLGYIFDQDMSNMPLIQRGVQAANPAAHHSRLGAYQEVIIQHWNALIDGYVAEAKQAANGG